MELPDSNTGLATAYLMHEVDDLLLLSRTQFLGTPCLIPSLPADAEKSANLADVETCYVFVREGLPGSFFTEIP